MALWHYLLSHQGPWDQEKFECLLTEWIVSCDQPFDEFEKEEFIKLITYMHHPALSIKVPSHEGVCRHVMKMGEDTIDGIHKMFAVWVPHSSMHSYLIISVGTQGKSCIVSWCMEFKQSVCIHSHRHSLYYKQRTVGYVNYIVFMFD